MRLSVGGRLSTAAVDQDHDGGGGDLISSFIQSILPGGGTFLIMLVGGIGSRCHAWLVRS